jgi:hypothetical protein
MWLDFDRVFYFLTNGSVLKRSGRSARSVGSNSRINKNFTPKVHFWSQGYRQVKPFLYLVNHWSQFNQQHTADRKTKTRVRTDFCLSPSSPRVFVLTCVSLFAPRVLSLSPLPSGHCLSLSVYLFVFLLFSMSIYVLFPTFNILFVVS